VENRSDYDLVFQQMNLIDSEAGDPDVSYLATTLVNEYEFDGEIVESFVDIHNFSGSDIIFTESLSNVIGFFDIVNDGGDILTEGSGVYIEVGDVGHLYISAGGNVGTVSDPFDTRLLRGKVLPDGSIGDMPAELVVRAGNDMFVDIRGYNTLADYTPGEKADGFALNFEAGGDIEVSVLDSKILDFIGDVPEGGGDSQYDVREADGIYNLYLASSSGGDVVIDIADGDLLLGGITTFLGQSGTSTTHMMGEHPANQRANPGSVSALAGNVLLRTKGSIYESDEDDSVVSGRDITMESQFGGVGSVLNPVDINSSLTVPGLVNVDASGSVFLHETSGDLRVGSIASSLGEVRLGSEASILDGSVNETAPDIAGQNAVLVANGGSVGESTNALELQVSGVEGIATGGVWLNNTGATNIGGVSAINGIAAGGPVVVTANSPLTVSGNVIAAGNITLTATESAGAGDDFTQNAASLIDSTGSSVLIRAGDDVDINGTVAAAGSITIKGDFGNADIAGTRISVRGSLNASSIQIDGDIDDDVVNLLSSAIFGVTTVDTYHGTDVININALAAGSVVNVNAGANTDVINVGSPANSLSGLLGDVYVNGDAHDAGTTTLTIRTDSNTLDTGDILNLNDQGDAGSYTYALTASTFARTGTGTVTYATIETLNLNTSIGAADVDVTTTAAGVNTTISTQDGADDIDVATTGLDSNVIINAAGGADDVNIVTSGGDGADGNALGSFLQVNAGADGRTQW
jgi:hypothetical protein